MDLKQLDSEDSGIPKILALCFFSFCSSLLTIHLGIPKDCGWEEVGHMSLDAAKTSSELQL